MKPNKWSSTDYIKKNKVDLKKYIEIFENQFIICLVLVGVAMLLKAINIPIAKTITEGTKSVLNYNMNYENTKKGLQLVMSKIPTFKEDVIKVFSNKSEDSKNVISNNATSRMIAPIKGSVVSKFGLKVDPKTGKEIKNDGVDISVSTGESVKAVLGGEVMIADETYPDLGKVVVLRHENDVRSVYAHLSEIDVKKGDKIIQGQVIGKIGETGKITAQTLHFEIWENGKPIDPLSKVSFDAPSSDVKK